MKSRYPLIFALLLIALPALNSQNRPVLTGPEQAISDRIRQLRSLPDDEWTRTVADLAKKLQDLPASPGKTALIGGLSNLVTEGDAGHDTLQAVAAMMAQLVRESRNSSMSDTLARLVRYEHLDVTVDTPEYHAAMAKLEAADQWRLSPDFTLTDLTGVKWSLKDLRGKVVLVNFWATWCPPCRKEMPDMEALYQRFGPRGLVILAISDEDSAKVQPFIAEHKYSYPILLDPGRKVAQVFGVEGIPKSFLYGRDGKLVTQAIDRRTERQFLAMLKLSGLD